VTPGYGQVTSGYWPAVVIGAVELLMLTVYTTAAVRGLVYAATPAPRYPSSGHLTNRPEPMMCCCGGGG
jgi:hypothetical protein